MTDGPRLTRQVAGSAIANVWLTLVGLITTPYLLHHLGSSAYGVFAMVGVVSLHLSNLELGFGHATIRYLARARAASDRRGERAILETSLVVFLIGGGTGALIVFSLAPYLVSSLFRIEHALQEQAVVAFRLGALILACSFVSSFASCALQALGRFDWLNGSRVMFGSAAALGAVVAVATGGGIRTVFVAQAGVALLASTTLAVALARIRGEGVRPRLDRGTLREMGRYGAIVFVGGIAYQWMINGPPFILAVYVSAASIPAFSIPHVILQKLMILVAAAGLAFLPFASAASAAADRSRLAAAFESNLRLTMLVMGPVTAYLGVFAPTLLGVWVSPDFALAAAPSLRLLAAAALVLALSGPPADVARGLGRPGWVLAYTFAVAIVGIGASVVAVPSHGPVGAAFGLLLGVLVGTFPLLFVVARRLLGLRARDMTRALAGPSAGLILVTTLYVAGAAIDVGLLGAVITGGLATAAYAAVGFLWILQPRERHALWRIAAQA
jgi:O-antigen/teichoic acid export membrane protein